MGKRPRRRLRKKSRRPCVTLTAIMRPRLMLPALGAALTIVPGVDHMGIVYRPEAIKAILAAMAETGA